ncbi:hypothetical protein AtubIFM55763_004876 [Aspergillus tubingensis]|nr:sigma-70 family RNA polymerase sigma factor [Aspergillus tubingensis]GAQ45759.1 putative aflatoxin biosynthesis ketoreductase nor-1 protein [Aspergillus niger]GFN11741.1 sigma-70 family RNA polymerase sigma factor [Aspergillus tubingensis]GLA66827.1 hypothetical protein AtubIFM54640_009413 [Aspergillus tubingensis]GLA73941.1 hypothetical protein AtubIFM55763_004876 [Aspergillus tubingensis]GLA85058.1 hypothetical protein AtubIFM56815_009282 [Aspergillus tubingensis]
MKWSTILSGAATAFACGSAAVTPITNRTNTGVEYVSGNYVPFQPGFLGGQWELFYSSNNVTLRGTGYLRLRWEIEYWKHSGSAADIIMKPNGTWLPVAGGGGYQMGDNSPAPYCNDPSGNCFNGTGGDTDGYVWFTNGHNPWHNEYYWLDGEVYLQTQEGPGDYNVGVSPITIDDILSDINTNISAAYHYGVSFDPKEGACPCSISPVSSTAVVASTSATPYVA